MGDALKKTRDAALVLIKATYGSAPTKYYFLGSSNGGREALTVAARWPADWDGVVALYPGRPFTTTILHGAAYARAFAAPGAFPNRAKRGVLRSAALATCDSLDGVSDGVISNVQGCNAAFIPSTALLNGAPVRCPGGIDTGDTCVSDAQLAALDVMSSPLHFNFPLASGETSHPGWPVFTSDLGVPGASALQELIAAFAIGTVASAFPVTDGMGFAVGIVDGFFRYAVVRNPEFNYLTLDPASGGAFAPRLSELSALDANDTNLSGFAAKGGKVLMMHGTEDVTVSPRTSEYYFQRLKATLGATRVDSFFRFYLIPGLAHSVSTTFNAVWDQLTALEDWVEQGSDPRISQIVTDTVVVPGRTRPLCIYPTWPKYEGSGDVNSAASFTCSAH